MRTINRSHTVELTIINAHIERIKDLVKTSPDFDFHWPFDINSITTFTSKENLTSEFEHLYDARGKNPGSIDEGNKISLSLLNNGSKVLIEYTPIRWSAKKSGSDVRAPFGSGCMLK